MGQAAGSIFLAGLLIGHIHMSEKMCPPDKSSPSGGLIIPFMVVSFWLCAFCRVCWHHIIKSVFACLDDEAGKVTSLFLITLSIFLIKGSGKRMVSFSFGLI